MTTTNHKIYANKRVLIKSKEHLDYVIEQTGMVIYHESIMVSLYTRVNKGLMICFEEDFDDNQHDWTYEYSYEYSPNEYENEYEESTLRMEEIFIDLPFDNE